MATPAVVFSFNPRDANPRTYIIPQSIVPPGVIKSLKKKRMMNRDSMIFMHYDIVTLKRMDWSDDDEDEEKPFQMYQAWMKLFEENNLIGKPVVIQYVFPMYD